MTTQSEWSKDVLQVLETPEINKRYVDNLIAYDSTSGKAFWKLDKGKARKGDEIKNIGSSGYIKLKIDNKSYQLHRIVWLIVYGEMPVETIDHINRNKLDNRIENLRLATKRQQMQNRCITKNNTSGVCGVHWVQRDKKWRAVIGDNKKKIYLGCYVSKLEAAKAVADAKKQYHEFS